jgi:hypothetical protein
MIVFQVSTNHTFKCIPSYYNGGEIVFNLRDELKNITYSIEYDNVFYQNFQLIIDFSGFQTIEGQSFEVTILENDAITYRGKAYVTAQSDLENYEMNNGILKV